MRFSLASEETNFCFLSVHNYHNDKAKKATKEHQAAMDDITRDEASPYFHQGLMASMRKGQYELIGFHFPESSM